MHAGGAEREHRGCYRGRRLTYAAVCTRHAAWRFVGGEIDRERHTLSLEGVYGDGAASPPVAAYSCVPISSDSVALWREVSNPELGAALGVLMPVDRAILSLRYSEGWHDADIARTVGITPASAQKRRYRAILRLRELLGPGDGR